MFITKRKHGDAINAKDAEIDGLMKRLKGQEEIADKLHHELWLLDNEIASLRQQLEPFKRTRGAGGRFVKAQPAYDEVRAQFESECG